jgi:Uma2 family endonuclease
MIEYMNNGAHLGWLIDRKNRKVEIYRQNREVEVLENPATLSGEEVLPGFVLDLTEVWGSRAIPYGIASLHAQISTAS